MNSLATAMIALSAMGAFLAPAAASARVGEAARWIEAGLEAERSHDPRTALAAFLKADEAQPDDAFVLQKIAQQLSDAALVEPDLELRRQLLLQARPYAYRAVELAPESAVNQLSLSVLYGSLASYGDVRSKVDYARKIRLHAEKALEADPGYAWAWHVLGRWHVEMSGIGMTRRAVAALFFGGLPGASLVEGVLLLERAVKLEPDAVPHHVELGEAYRRAGRPKMARQSWERALALPVMRVYDSAAKERARALLEGSFVES